jgi:predicted aspartyl protease
MSSSPLIVFMALSSLLVLPGGAVQTAGGSVRDLLARDEIDQAEALLNSQPKTAESVAFRGEIEFRRGNFGQAEALYKDALAMDAKTARAHFGIGRLAMTRLSGKESVEAMRRAIELDPKEPLYRLYASEAWAIDKNFAEERKSLEEYLALNPNNDPDRFAQAKAGLEVLNAFGSREMAKVEAPEVPAPIRIRKSLNLLFTSAMINGKGPYELAIDTGASMTVFSDKVIRDFNLKPITSTVMHGVGGAGKIDTGLFGIDEISFGEVKVRNVPAGTFNDPLITQLADGILGTATFMDFIVSIDYPAGRLELSRKQGTVTGESIPARFFSNLLLVPLDVNGHQGNFVVDTGAVTTVLSHNMAEKLGVNAETPGARIDLGVAGVGGFEGLVLRVRDVTFTAGRIKEHYPQVVSIDLKQISKMIGTEVSGVIGYDFFENYKLTLDYFGGQVWLGR